MKHFLTIFAVSMFLCTMITQAQEITDLRILQRGGYILFFRHASAPGGIFPNGTGNDINGPQESQWWKSCDPATGRQLSTIGRYEAMTIGRVMRAQNIRVGRMFTSEYCRAYESAMLMNMNTTLNYSTAATFTIYPDAERIAGLQEIIKQAPVSGTNTVVWTHGTNQGEFAFAGLGWSDASVYQYSTTAATARFVGTIRYPVWAQATIGTSVVATNTIPELSLSISPNPASERLSMTLGEKADVVIVNAIGTEMYSEADVFGTKNISLTNYPSGAYFVTAGTGTKRVTKKFTKQ